jgi:hypothetical protein
VFSGGGFSLNATFPAATMTLEVNPSLYEDMGDTRWLDSNQAKPLGSWV